MSEYWFSCESLISSSIYVSKFSGAEPERAPLTQAPITQVPVKSVEEPRQYPQYPSQPSKPTSEFAEIMITILKLNLINSF